MKLVHIMAKNKKQQTKPKPKVEYQMDGFNMPFEEVMKALARPETKENKNKKA